MLIIQYGWDAGHVEGQAAPDCFGLTLVQKVAANQNPFLVEALLERLLENMAKPIRRSSGVSTPESVLYLLLCLSQLCFSVNSYCMVLISNPFPNACSCPYSYSYRVYDASTCSRPCSSASS